MTFLDPTSGLVAAAIAFPLLAAMYMLRLRRRPLRVSSTLLWEQAVKDLQVNVPLRWIKFSLLLLLQALALGAFVAALARPAVPGPAPVADRVVVIIDHSASMSARDGSSPPAPAARMRDDGAISPPTRLEEAKARAIEYVRSLGRSSGRSGERPRVQVIESAANARIVQAYTSDTRQLIDAITSIEPTDQAGSDEEGTALAASILFASTGSPDERTEVVAFTDQPRGEAGGSITATSRAVIVGPAGVPADQRRPTDNLGIVALNARRDLARPEDVLIFVRLAGAAGSPTRTPIRCLIDGSLAAIEQVDVPAAGGGAAAISFRAARPAACTITVTIDRDDLLAADNSASIRMPAATSPAVLVVAPPESADADPRSSAASPDPFLISALRSLDLATLRTVTPAAYADEVAQANAEQRPAWSRYSIIVFDRVAPARPPSQPSLSFGAAIPGSGVELSDLAAAPDSGAAVRFTTWSRSHPLLRYVGLDPIVLSPPPPMLNVPDRDPPPPGVNFTPLAFAPGGPAIGVIESAAAGRVTVRRIFVAFALERSSWGPDFSFPVFISGAIDALTGREGGGIAGAAWTTSQPVTVATEPGAKFVRAYGPTSREVAIDIDAQASLPDGPVAINLGILPRAGVYMLEGALDPMVCVNLLNDDETRLGSTGVQDAARTQTARSDDSPAREAGPAAGEREVWHWFVLAGLVLATIDWFVYGRGVRA